MGYTSQSLEVLKTQCPMPYPGPIKDGSLGWKPDISSFSSSKVALVQLSLPTSGLEAGFERLGYREGQAAAGPGSVMGRPALLSLLPVFSFSFFFPSHLQLTFPADETEHFLPAPTLITRCLPGERLSLSLFRAPRSSSKAEGAGRGQAGFTRVTPIKTNVSSLSAGCWCSRPGV